MMILYQSNQFNPLHHRSRVAIIILIDFELSFDITDREKVADTPV